MTKRQRDRAPPGADPSGWHPETSWAATMMEINAGRSPDLQRIARALKRGDAPVPRPVRDFLADYLTGERKRPKGRPQRDLYETRLCRGVIDSMYAHALEVAEAEGAPAPAEVAVERVASEVGMSAGSVRDALGRRNGWEDEAAD